MNPFEDRLIEKYRNNSETLQYIEITRGEKIENFIQEYPAPFWLSVAAILIFCLWKLLKMVIYQITYTITKAIKDASKQ